MRWRRSRTSRRAKATRGPTLTDDFELAIVAGRHPVVERMMPRDKFIPNDVQLPEDARLVILTGPNMAGKSTILRQVGLIVATRAGGELRARGRRDDRRVRPRLHARRRERQSRARAVHVHGGDGGDERHPASRDAPEPRAARRDRSRDEHVRRRVDRVGGERAPAQHASAARRSSRRTTTSSSSWRTNWPR